MKRNLLIILSITSLATGNANNESTLIQDNLYQYPEIIQKSAPNLKLIKNNWKSQPLICSESEDFLILRKVSQERFVAVSSEEDNNQYNFYFYDIDLNGKILHKSTLPDSDFGIDNRLNFIIAQDSIYYFTSKSNRTTFSYSLSNHTHQKSKTNQLNWQQIEDWKNESRYSSMNNNAEIFLSGTQLILTQNTQPNDTLINQKYDGTWSFRQGSWSSDNTKFYFDNSGAVACIWEINLNNKTLDKIVPDHWARSPIYLFDQTDAVLYSNKKCIYITRKDTSSIKTKGPSQVLSTDSLTTTTMWYDQLLKNYINKSENQLIQSSRLNTAIRTEWLLDRIEKTDNEKFFVFQIGHDVLDEDNTNLRFTTDGWIYLDSLSKTIYEYDLPNDTLIKWQEHK
jgi:hypothetical protein